MDVYFYRPHIGGSERSGSLAGTAPCSPRVIGMGIDRVCTDCDDCLGVSKPLGVSKSLEKLRECKQLGIPRRLLRDQRYLLGERQTGIYQ